MNTSKQTTTQSLTVNCESPNTRCESPNIRCESPIYMRSPNASTGSPTYYRSRTPQTFDGTPPCTPHAERYFNNDNDNKNNNGEYDDINSAHPPAHSPREEHEITITDAIHIPRWAIGYVLGGRANKHLNNILRGEGNLIEKVGEPVSHKLRSGKIVMVLTLIGSGVHSTITTAMTNVKRSLINAIKKAKQMKTDGTWVDNRQNKNNNNRNNRNSSRRNDDRRKDHRRNDRHDRRSYDRHDRHSYDRHDRRSYDRHDRHYVNDHRDGYYREEYY